MSNQNGNNTLIIYDPASYLQQQIINIVNSDANGDAYTPVYSDLGTGVDSITNIKTSYIKVGKIVTVFTKHIINVTLNAVGTSANYSISVPFKVSNTSMIPALLQYNYDATTIWANNLAGLVANSATGQKVSLSFKLITNGGATATSSIPVSYSFQYETA